MPRSGKASLGERFRFRLISQPRAASDGSTLFCSAKDHRGFFSFLPGSRVPIRAGTLAESQFPVSLVRSGRENRKRITDQVELAPGHRRTVMGRGGRCTACQIKQSATAFTARTRPSPFVHASVVVLYIASPIDDSWISVYDLNACIFRKSILVRFTMYLPL